MARLSSLTEGAFMAIRTKTRSLGDLICGRKIIVPKIQRPYSWATGSTSDNEASKVAVTALYEDLVTYHLKNEEYGYYLGSLIILVDEGETDDNDAIWHLLDGQQRITTLSLLFNEIYKTLQLYDDEEIPGLQEILEAIEKNWINLDMNSFDPPEDSWTWTVYPRREEDRRVFRKLMEYTPIDEIDDSLLKTAAKEFDEHLKKWTPSEILGFTKTLLEKVTVSVIITDEQPMAYQMFQTANARGTQLTSLDLFRSTVVKRAEADLKLDETHIKSIMNELDETEVSISVAAGLSREDVKKGKPQNDATAKKKEAITKELMKSWVACRIGKVLPRGLIPYITHQVEKCDDYLSLFTLVKDLRQHARTWEAVIEKSPNERLLHDPFQPMFNIVHDQWKWLGLGVKNLFFHQGNITKISIENLNAIMEIKTWWAIGKYGVYGETHKMPFTTWAKEANMAWKHNSCAPDSGTTVWDKNSFGERCKDRLGDIEFDLLRDPFSIVGQDVSNTLDERKLVRARAVLAMFETHAEEFLDDDSNGFGPTRHGKGTKDVRIAPLFSPRQIGLADFTRIGNWFLLRGAAQNGLSLDDVKQQIFSCPDGELRVSKVREYSSPASKRNIPRYHDGAPEHRKFVIERSMEIAQVLTDAMDSFIENGWEEDSPDSTVETTIENQESDKVRIKVTQSMLAKANIDASIELREALKRWNVIDFDKILAGSENKKIIPITVIVDGSTYSRINMSCYRTNNRGFRFWIERLGSLISSERIFEFSINEGALIAETTILATNAHGRLWSDEEIRVCVYEYLDYRDTYYENPSLAPTKSSVYNRLSSSGPTNGRSPKAIEYRFCNISAVLWELGQKIIPGLLPRGNVGTDVKEKIKAMIEEYNLRND